MLYDLSNKTTDSGSPNDTTPVTRQINAGCQGHPDRASGRRDGVLAPAVARRCQRQPLSGFSNRGLGVIDVAAPGSRIASTVLGGGYAFLSGTSMASPNAAGVMALLKSTHPTWGPDQLGRASSEQATPKACGTTTGGAPCVGTPEMNSYFGHGVVDAPKAVVRIPRQSRSKTPGNAVSRAFCPSTCASRVVGRGLGRGSSQSSGGRAGWVGDGAVASRVTHARHEDLVVEQQQTGRHRDREQRTQYSQERATGESGHHGHRPGTETVRCMIRGTKTQFSVCW